MPVYYNKLKLMLVSGNHPTVLRVGSATYLARVSTYITDTGVTVAHPHWGGRFWVIDCAQKPNGDVITQLSRRRDLEIR